MDLTQLVIEGDSQIIISLATKILNGFVLERVSPSWRLLSSLEVIHSLLCHNLTQIPSHIRREANEIADKLANEGVSLSGDDLSIDARLLPAPPLLTQCFDLAQWDYSSLDGVPLPHATQSLNADNHRLPFNLHSYARHNAKALSAGLIHMGNFTL